LFNEVNQLSCLLTKTQA